MSEFTTCTIAMTAGNVYGLLFTFAFGWMLEINLVGYCNCGLVSISVIGLVLALLCKVPMKRTEMDHLKPKSNNNIESGYESVAEPVVL